LFAGPRWVSETKTGRLTVGRNVTLTLNFFTASVVYSYMPKYCDGGGKIDIKIMANLYIFCLPPFPGIPRSDFWNAVCLWICDQL
jgi:hypothetical protein